jgi:hypothetical protein
MRRLRVPSHLVHVLVCLALLGAAERSGAQVEPATFRLIDRELESRIVHLLEIADDEIVVREPHGEQRAVPIDRCIALIRVPELPVAVRGVGRLAVADGQLLPGTPARREAATPGVLMWQHDLLDRLGVSVDDVAAVTFRPSAPLPVAGQNDTVVLRNGDRLEGFVVSLGDPVVIEMNVDGQSRAIELARDRVSGAALVTSREASDRRRVWFRDGTVLDVDELTVRDDGFVRVRASLASAGSAPKQVQLDKIRAVLFAPGAFVPLSDLVPSAVEATSPRYVVPPPRALGAAPALDLAPVEYRGPILVRYMLPPGTRYFAADVELPEAARLWGDCELIVRVDDDEIFRTHLDGDAPLANFNVPTLGSELTIELTRGANGPIDDRLILHRAMLLLDGADQGPR